LVLKQRLDLLTRGRRLYALDLETECAVTGCTDKSCKHGLSPFTNRITLIAIVGDNYRRVYKTLEFAHAVSGGAYRGASFVGHNLKFDFIQLRHHIPHFKALIDLERAFTADTMIMAHTHVNKVDPHFLADYETERQSRNAAGEKHRKASGLSLKTLAPYFLKTPAFWEVADKDDVEYVTKDTQYTYDLAIHFLTHMSDPEFEFMQKRMIGWQRMLLLAEERGVLIDSARLTAMQGELEVKERELRAELDVRWAAAHAAYRAILIAEVDAKYTAMKNQKIAAKNKPGALAKLAYGFDYDSPKQMLWYLKDYCGYNVSTFEGDESTGRGVLERLADEGHDDIKLFLDWRKTQKLLTAFLPTYNEYLEMDEAIHPSFHLCGTRTGRLSCSEPNVQQLPKDVKQLLVPRPGYKFVTYDLAAIEAKLIAWFAEDPVLYHIIADGISIHDYNSKVFFNLDCDISEVKTKYPAQRKAAKTCGFSLLYGAGANRIREAFSQAGFILSESQAKTVLENFRRRFEVSYRFHRDITRQFENFETVQNAVGRPIYIQSWDSAFMQGMNTLVQSSASDMNLLVAERALKNAANNGIEAYLLLLVHDSLSFEVKETDVKNFVDKCLLPVYNEFKLETAFGAIPITAEGEIQERYG
jgi:DNA polymerase I-like protein with 3'-5' exonuclease and polymerase domains